MKLFMYHYVREDDHNNSYSRHKNINDFKKECEVIKKENTFLCINQISEKMSLKIILLLLLLMTVLKII